MEKQTKNKNNITWYGHSMRRDEEIARKMNETKIKYSLPVRNEIQYIKVRIVK